MEVAEFPKGIVDPIEERRILILESARTLFLERGFRATTLNDVVLRSGGSMTTVYRLFGNKVGLLRAIIDYRCSEILPSISAHELRLDCPRTALTTLAGDIIDRLVESVSLLRVVIAESLEEPDLGKQLYERGVMVTAGKLTEVFRKLGASGLLSVRSASDAAMMFHRAVIGQYELRLLLGLETTIDARERRRHIDAVVEATLLIHRAAPAPHELSSQRPKSGKPV